MVFDKTVEFSKKPLTAPPIEVCNQLIINELFFLESSLAGIAFA